MSSFRLRLFITSLTLLGCPALASGQVVGGQSLAGDWVRVISNNNPNDQMRVHVAGDATLTSVPAAASPYWKVGQVLWRGIQSNGTLEVRGSDGQYYSARLTFSGPDEVSLAISLRTAGDAQTWRRAGPSIDGDWVQIAPAGDPNDGMRIRVQGTDGTIRYLPPTAPRSMRVSAKMWQNIRARGALDIRGSDGRYHAGTVTILAPDRLQIDSNAPQVGNGRIWVRPGIVQTARAALQPPPANPNAPGSGLQPPGNLPGVPVTPGTPPIVPAPPAACLATSLPHDRTGLTWGWGMSTPGPNGPVETRLGIWEYVGSPPALSGSGDVPADIEVMRYPSGLPDGRLWVWDRRSRRVRWEQGRGETLAGLTQRMQNARTAGLRPADIEARDMGPGVGYSSVWESNPEAIDWKLEVDLTSQDYGTAFGNYRNNGYRLVDMEAYQTTAGLRYAAVWWASCDDTNWRQLRNMGRQAYQDSVDAHSQRGFRVIDFESYTTSAGQRYAAIWQRVPAGRGWAVRTDRDLTWFLNYQQEYVDDGMRLLDFESYDTPNGVRYAGIWAENDARYDYPFKAALEDSVAAYRARHTIPGMSVVAMLGDSIIYQGGFGWADSAAQKRANSRTIYITASVAKAIGATMAARLERQGHVDLRDTTSTILTYLSSQHTHTLEQLLGKVGCIRHYDRSVPRQFVDPNQTRNANGTIISDPTWYRWRDSAVKRIQSPLLSNCTPGQRYLYSTHGFTFVGAALEAMLGKDIDAIFNEELFRPFQLFSMNLVGAGVVADPNGGMVPSYHLAQGYVFDTTTVAPGTRRGIVLRNYEDTSWKVMGGGLQTDALDLARFARLTLTGQIADTTRLWTSQTTGAVNHLNPMNTFPNTGLAWVLAGRNPRLVGTTIRNRTVAEHGGDGVGGRSWLGIYREDELIVAILTNQNMSSSLLRPHPVSTLGETLAGVIFANPPPP